MCPGCRHTTRHDTTRPVCTGTHTRHVPTRPNEIWGFHGRTTRTKFRGFRVRTTRTKFRGFRGRTTRTKPRGSIRQTGHTNMQRTHERSRLSIFGTPTCARAPHTARHGPTGLVRADPTRPNAFARAPTHDTTRPDPNKIWGFLICTTRTKFGVSMGARPERRHKAASGKRAARTCRRHTGGHDLAFLALPRVPEHPRTAGPDPPEQRHDGASGKQVARTCRRHMGGHALSFFARPHVPEHPRAARHDPTPLDSPERVCTGTHTRHDLTRPNGIWGFHVCTPRTKFGVSMGARPERRPEGASGKRAARMCRRHTGGDDLEILARPRVPGHPHTARHDPTRPGRADPNRPNEIWGFHGCTTRTKKAHGQS